MSVEAERRAVTFDRALGLFLGSFIGGATTAMYHADWWAAPLGALSVVAFCFARWKTVAS